MDIVPGDKDKHIIRIAAWWLRKKYKAGNRDAIHDDMVNCGNPVIRKLYKKIVKDSDFIKENFQKDTVVELTELFLWILERDTAYRDVFFYMMKEMIDMKEDLYPMLEKYYKNPDNWYVNVWHDTKENTAKKVKKGEIPRGTMSPDETYFVPEVQKQRINELEKELNVELEKKKRRRTAW